MNEYVYCANNPITFIDPDGDIPIVLVAMVAWNMYNIYSTAKDAKSFAKKPTLGGGIMVAAGVTPVGKVKGVGKVVKQTKKIVRSQAVKKQFLKSQVSKSPKWMKPQLTKGKVPRGYNVEHQIALGDKKRKGKDVISNMRLKLISDHKTRHRHYRYPNWGKKR